MGQLQLTKLSLDEPGCWMNLMDCPLEVVRVVAVGIVFILEVAAAAAAKA